MSTDDKILDAALRVFAEGGLRGATTRRIAEEAGVNEVTLFRRFGTKDQLLVEAMRTHGERHPLTPLPEEPRDPAAELGAWCRQHLERLLEVRVLIRTTMSEMQSHPALCHTAGDGPRRIHDELTTYLERLRARGLATGDWDARLAASMLMGALFSEAVGPDARDRHPFDIDRTATEYVALYLRAIGARTEEPTG